MNLVKFLQAASSGSRASQAAPLVSAASRGITTNDTAAKSNRRNRVPHADATKGNDLSNQMMN